MYRGIGAERGNIVDDTEAFEYALARCVNGSEEEKEWFKGQFLTAFPDFISELRLCFFSGNWIEEEKDAEII